MKTEEKYLVKLGILSTIEDSYENGEVGERSESELRVGGLHTKESLAKLIESFIPYGTSTGIRDDDNGGYTLSADWMVDEDERELSKRGLLEWKFRGKKALRMEVEIFFKVIQTKTITPTTTKLAKTLGVSNWS